MKLQNVFMQLRKVCNHPALFDDLTEEPGPVTERIITDSGKMMLLRRLLTALIAKGHRTLIFCQMTNMLDIIADWLDALTGWDYFRIDGSTSQSDRVEMIKEFNSNESIKLFLLSTRAGGLGINLATVDLCRIFTLL